MVTASSTTTPDLQIDPAEEDMWPTTTLEGCDAFSADVIKVWYFDLLVRREVCREQHLRLFSIFSSVVVDWLRLASESYFTELFKMDWLQPPDFNIFHSP